MERIIKSIDEKHYLQVLDFVKKVFSDSEDEQSGELVKIKLLKLETKNSMFQN